MTFILWMYVSLTENSQIQFSNSLGEVVKLVEFLDAIELSIVM